MMLKIYLATRSKIYNENNKVNKDDSLFPRGFETSLNLLKKIKMNKASFIWKIKNN